MARRVDPGKKLGATHPVGVSQIVFFVPAGDRKGVPINQNRWRDEALRVFGTLFRGATAFPPGQGVWRDDAAGGALLFEQTVMVVSYVNPADLNEKAWKNLRAFLHSFGRESNQGEVGIVIDGQYFGISAYDVP